MSLKQVLDLEYLLVEHIGIDEKVRALSALAIRTVLEEDGPSYQNIRAVVFALPIFDDRHIEMVKDKILFMTLLMNLKNQIQWSYSCIDC